MDEEIMAAILKETAVRRFGEEEARQLDRAILETAKAAAATATVEFTLEEEPAFCR